MSVIVASIAIVGGGCFVGTQATQAEIHADICAQCLHSSGGKQKRVDTAKRAGRFRQKGQAGG